MGEYNGGVNLSGIARAGRPPEEWALRGKSEGIRLGASLFRKNSIVKVVLYTLFHGACYSVVLRDSAVIFFLSFWHFHQIELLLSG